MKGNYFKTGFILVVLLLAFSSLFAKEYLIVRVDANYPPYEMVENGELTGLHIEMVKAVAKRLDIDVTFQSYPWKRAITMVQDGEADAITYIGKTPEREKFVFFESGNILSSSNYGFIILKSNKNRVKFNGDLKSLTGYKIGVNRGYSYGDEFDSADYLQKDETGTVDQLVKKLHAGRVDMAVIDEPEYLQSRGKAGWENIIFLYPILTERNFYIGFSKTLNHDELAGKFSNEMEKFKKTAEYRKLLKKYNLN